MGGLFGKGRIYYFMGILVVLSLSVFLSAADVAAKNYNWKISQGIAEDHPAAARCKQFAKLVEEKSGGRIKLN